MVENLPMGLTWTSPGGTDSVMQILPPAKKEEAEIYAPTQVHMLFIRGRQSHTFMHAHTCFEYISRHIGAVLTVHLCFYLSDL